MKALMMVAFLCGAIATSLEFYEHGSPWWMYINILTLTIAGYVSGAEHRK